MVTNLLSSILGSSANGNSGDKEGGNSGGLGKNLLGAPGDPAGTAVDLIQQKQRADEQKRQWELTHQIALKALADSEEQQAVENEQSNRKTGFGTLSLLAGQRADAQQQANLRGFRNSLFA